MENNDITNKFFLPAAVILAGLFIAGAVLWNGSHPTTGTGGQAAGAAPAAPVVDIKNVNTAGHPFIGSENAPVTIAFWSDYQCPFCKRFETDTLPQIITNYVATGKVKVVFLDFPFLGSDSIDGALYSRAVWKLYPNQYLAWHEAMTAAQDEEGDKGFGKAATIDKLNATIAGLDAAKIAADVKANTAAYRATVDADRAEAGKVGVSATPSFVIGKTLIQGAYPYANFQAAIDAALK
ncbi:MAG: thioredoxin domain-containing protein [Candidatus Paceibacterota bacterium]|jgi:protein-disulfide isomerase